MSKKLPTSFYLNKDVVQAAKLLLGKKLCTNFDGNQTSGIITETEAYCAPQDPASHAYQMLRTRRTEAMYAAGGHAYVYLIYGRYNLFNVVTNVEGTPHAVLVRAIEPIDGMDTMLNRKKMSAIKKKLTAGPGLLTEALGIRLQHNGCSLLGNNIWIEQAPDLPESKINASPRIGLGKKVFEPYITMPWRFCIAYNAWLSNT
ncbi:MAG: DNA-3-methyladenine glycosylase [Flavobacteriales bacterium]